MIFAARAAEVIAEEKPDGVFVDGTGMGAGVVDRLNQLGHKVLPVMVGDRNVHHPEKYFNVRAEIWGRMKDWFAEADADLPRDDQEFEDDLIGIQYGYDVKDAIQLESKKDMKRRGLASPDSGDALALTFFLTLARKRRKRTRRRNNWRA